MSKLDKLLDEKRTTERLLKELDNLLSEGTSITLKNSGGAFTSTIYVLFCQKRTPESYARIVDFILKEKQIALVKLQEIEKKVNAIEELLNS